MRAITITLDDGKLQVTFPEDLRLARLMMAKALEAMSRFTPAGPALLVSSSERVMSMLEILLPKDDRSALAMLAKLLESVAERGAKEKMRLPGAVAKPGSN